MESLGRNYFNYFTEIEEHFQRVRGTSLFLLSPIDWALIESWKNGGVPLEAVLRGIDAAFEKWRTRKVRTQAVNSLAYCAQAVMAEAEVLAAGTPVEKAAEPAPFPAAELRSYLMGNSAALRSAGFPEEAATLDRLARELAEEGADLEELERHLTVLEEKLVAALRSRQSEEQLLEARRRLDSQLRAYRGKMSAPQLAMLEKQYLERHLLEAANVPRLSLFYFR